MKGALDSIQVEGFKSIRSMNLELRPLNVLIGPNGVGKSNFIGVFRLLKRMLRRELQIFTTRAGGTDALLYFGRKTTSEINIRLDVSNSNEHAVSNTYECTLAPTDDDFLFFKEEHLWLNNDSQGSLLGGGHRETHLTDEYHKPVTGAEDLISAMRSWQVYHLHDTSAEAKVKQTCDLHTDSVLYADAANLAAFLYLLQEQYPASYRNIVDTLRMVAPFFDDFVLKPLALNKEKIRLSWLEKGSSTPFGPNALSDGTLRFISLATLLLQPKLPAVILLDEPELGLHPFAITLLAELLRSTSTKTQVILATQSVTLVNQLDPGDVIVGDRKEGQTDFKRLDRAPLEDWLDDYGMGDLWEKNLFGGRP